MECNLADLWERVADTVPGSLALVCGPRRLSYAATEERANRLAHALAARGIGPGDHVALYLYNSTEYLEGMLAAFKLRAVPINVNYRYVTDELRHLLADADAKAVVFHREFAPKLAAIRPQLPLLVTYLTVHDTSGEGPPDAAVAAAEHELGATEYEAALTASSPERDFGPRSADDLYILYTGGTTGMPKGVMWRHVDVFYGALGGGGVGAAPIAAPEEIAERCTQSRTRCLPACPLMHGTAHWISLATLYTGGTVILPGEHHFDPLCLLELVARESANLLVIVGDAFARPLVDMLVTPAGRALDLSGLRVLLSGGAVLSPTVKEALVRVLPETLVVDGFGASETGGQGQAVTVAGGEIDDAARFRFDPDTAVLDDQLRPAPPGTIGRLARRGHVPLGYYKDPVKSAATFPVVDGVRWSVPGDYAVAGEDGTVTVLGRGSVSINTGGEKVYPEEVERVLKSHPRVFDAVVVGTPDERWGEAVTAVVQLRPGAGIAGDELRDHARGQLAAYKVPRRVVVVDAIVRSPSGKADYRWARATAGAAARR